MQNGSLDTYRLNFAITTFIPKELDAKEMKKWLISLTNCVDYLFY